MTIRQRVKIKIYGYWGENGRRETILTEVLRVDEKMAEIHI